MTRKTREEKLYDWLVEATARAVYTLASCNQDIPAWRVWEEELDEDEREACRMEARNLIDQMLNPPEGEE